MKKVHIFSMQSESIQATPIQPTAITLDQPFQTTKNEDAINAQMQELTRGNTSKAYDNKGLEFLQFCREVYSREGELATMVSEEKLYLFLYYQAHRGKRKAGAKRAAVFSITDYNDVMNRPIASISETTNVIGYDCLNQYYSIRRFITQIIILIIYIPLA
jgi:hypothetical protein